MPKRIPSAEDDIINNTLKIVPNARETLELAIKWLKESGFDMKNQDVWSLAEKLLIVTGEIFDSKMEEARRYGEAQLQKHGFGTRKLRKALDNLARQHGGETVEEILSYILQVSGIRFERKVKLGTKDFPAEADFVIPGKKFFEIDKRCVILISVKRKVRERWKLTVGDAYILRAIHGYPDNIWFVTLAKRDEVDLPVKAVKVFTRLGISVYVPDPVFERYSRYDSSKERNKVRKFSWLIDDIVQTLKRCQGVTLYF
jgi:hypothetical protein